MAANERTTHKNEPVIVRECNICHTHFKTRNRFRRFCDRCRELSDKYRFADSLNQSRI